MMEDFIAKFAEVIERDGEIKMEDEFRNYDEWSSLVYLSLVVMMDEEYGVQIEQSEFKKLKTVRDLYNACMSK